MLRATLLGRIVNICVLREKAVLQRRVFTVAGSAKGNEVPRSTSETNYDEIILAPVKHVMQLPGKKMTKEVARSFNYWLKVPADKLLLAEDISQNFYNSVILMDDILDNSILRRGIPTAHSIFGVLSTLTAANYVLIKGLKEADGLNHPEAMATCTKHLLDACWGQGVENYWRDNYTCPSEDEYQEMVLRTETHGITMFQIGLMQLLSDNKADFTPLTNILALYAQIRNDYCNLHLKQYSKEKGFCEDITEGKFSFPIIHAIKSRPDDSRVMYILQKRTRDVELKKFCVALLEKFGSFSYTRKTLEKLDAEVRAEVAKLGGNSMLEAILDEMLNWK